MFVSTFLTGFAQGLGLASIIVIAFLTHQLIARALNRRAAVEYFEDEAVEPLDDAAEPMGFHSAKKES